MAARPHRSSPVRPVMADHVDSLLKKLERISHIWQTPLTSGLRIVSSHGCLPPQSDSTPRRHDTRWAPDALGSQKAASRFKFWGSDGPRQENVTQSLQKCSSFMFYWGQELFFNVLLVSVCGLGPERGHGVQNDAGRPHPRRQDELQGWSTWHAITDDVTSETKNHNTVKINTHSERQDTRSLLSEFTCEV